MLYILLLMYSLFYFHLQKRTTKIEICRLTFTAASSIPNISTFYFFSISIFLITRRVPSYYYNTIILVENNLTVVRLFSTRISV